MSAPEALAPGAWRDVVSVEEDPVLGTELRARLARATGPRAIGVTDLLALRRTYFRLTGPTVPPSPARQARLDVGRATHRSLGARLAAEGILEARVRREGFVGRIDLLADVPVEVKTSSALVSPSALSAERPDHVEQLSMYCALLRRRTGRLLTLVAQPSGVHEVQAVDLAFGAPEPILEEMRRRERLLRAAVSDGSADALPRCPWFGRSCEYQEAALCSCQGNEPSAPASLAQTDGTPVPRPDVEARVRSALSPAPPPDEFPVERFREILYPRRAYYERSVERTESPPDTAPPPRAPDLYSRLIESLESGPAGEVARLAPGSTAPEEEVVGFRGLPVLVKTSRAWARVRPSDLVDRSPQYALDLGLRCAATGTGSGVLVLGFERAQDDREQVEVLRVRFTNVSPFSRVYRERSRAIAVAVRDRAPGALPTCPDWMVSDCPYRAECGCGSAGGRVTR